MRILVVRGQSLKSGISVVTGAIGIQELLPRAVIPYRDTLKKEGYQRRPQETRITRFANDLKTRGTDVPTSILLNIREKSHFVLNDIGSDGDRWLEVDHNAKFFVVDGQHRVLAFKKLFDEDDGKWIDYKLHFVLMLGATATEEMNQFYVVNTTAKSVKTDLALDLLKQRSDADGKIMEDLIKRGQDWKVEAQEIVDSLFAKSPVWKGKIQLANAEKKETIIPAASFINSLKAPLTKSAVFQKSNFAKRVKILDSYWSGIRKSLREAFDGDPRHFALQKGIGVTAMHEILPTVIEIIRSKGDSVVDSDAYEEIMTGTLAKLEGDNVDGELVAGAEFWLTAPRGGAAGSFSSSAGKRVLFAKLNQLLPELDVE